MSRHTATATEDHPNEFDFRAVKCICLCCGDMMVARVYKAKDRPAGGVRAYCHFCNSTFQMPSYEQGIENFLRVQRVLLQPQGRNAYLQLLLALGDDYTDYSEHLKPWEALFPDAKPPPKSTR